MNMIKNIVIVLAMAVMLLVATSTQAAITSKEFNQVIELRSNETSGVGSDRDTSSRKMLKNGAVGLGNIVVCPSQGAPCLGDDYCLPGCFCDYSRPVKLGFCNSLVE